MFWIYIFSKEGRNANIFNNNEYVAGTLYKTRQKMYFHYLQNIFNYYTKKSVPSASLPITVFWIQAFLMLVIIIVYTLKRHSGIYSLHAFITQTLLIVPKLWKIHILNLTFYLITDIVKATQNSTLIKRSLKTIHMSLSRFLFLFS